MSKVIGGLDSTMRTGGGKVTNQHDAHAKLGIKADDRICLCGLPGTGKTVMLEWLAELPPQTYVIDALQQYSDMGEEGDVYDLMQPGKNHLRYFPKAESPKALEDIAKKLHRISNTTLIIEEAEAYLPQGKMLYDYTSSLIRRGRNWGIGVWLTTRRIQDINKRFFDLCQHVIFFRCGLKSREYIAGMIGNDYVIKPLRSQYNQLKYGLTTLPKYHALHVNLETEEANIIYLNIRGKAQHLLEVGGKGKVNKEEEAEAE